MAMPLKYLTGCGLLSLCSKEGMGIAAIAEGCITGAVHSVVAGSLGAVSNKDVALLGDAYAIFCAGGNGKGSMVVLLLMISSPFAQLKEAGVGNDVADR